MARPQRRITKKVKDQNLVESVVTLEESTVSTSKADDNIVDKGFYLEEKTDKEVPFSQVDIQDIKRTYEKKIKELEVENTKLKSSGIVGPFDVIKSRKLRNNMKRLMRAISLESEIQGTEWPVLSTNKLRKTYKVTADSFRDCLSYGLENGWIRRKEISYSGNVKTWAYKAEQDIAL